MTPNTIKTKTKQTKLTNKQINNYPTYSITKKKINTNNKTHYFTSYINIHTLKTTNNQIYSQIPQYTTTDKKNTNNPNTTNKNPNKQPLNNPTHNI